MELEQILNQLSQIKNINSGGCGLVAYGLYKHLENTNQLGETYICFVEEEDYSFEMDFDFVMEGNAKGVNHVMLYHNGKWIDSSGIYDDPFECWLLHEFESYPTFFDIKENINKFMKNALFGKGWDKQWNNFFDRECYLPQIEKILGVKF